MPSAGGGTAGGPANGTARLVKGLREAGESVAVVTATTRGDEAPATLHGARVVAVPHDPRLSLARGMREWRSAGKRAVLELEPDVVHGQGVVDGGLVAAEIESVPTVLTARGNARNDTLHAYPGMGGRARAFLRDRLARRAVRNVDLVVGVHPDWRTNLPVEPRAFRYIPNVVDDAFFATTWSPVGKTVLYCGGARAIKGWDVLHAAWAAVAREAPDARLKLVGWPADEPLSGAFDVCGPLAPADLASELGAASVVVIPSRFEAAPILLAEAWAVGVPVVATDAGGMATLAPGAAVVVPRESPAELAAAIVDVVERRTDAELLVAEGNRRAERHRAEAVVRAHLSTYAELVDPVRGRASGS